MNRLQTLKTKIILDTLASGDMGVIGQNWERVIKSGIRMGSILSLSLSSVHPTVIRESPAFGYVNPWITNKLLLSDKAANCTLLHVNNNILVGFKD